MSRPEENLHLWRLVAEEYGCLDGPYPFASDHARFLFYRQDRPNLHHVPHEAFRCTVTMLSGIPGAGKDAWIAANLPGQPVVSLDEIRRDLDIDPEDDQGEAVQAGRQHCREYLRAGRSFVFNATNLFRQTRRRWIELFDDYGARIEIVYIEPPLPVILEQNARRNRPVPEKVIRRLAEKCEPPTLAESHRLTIVDGSTTVLPTTKQGRKQTGP
jgi:predicted kinase